MGCDDFKLQYNDFIRNAKTGRLACSAIRDILKQSGFVDNEKKSISKASSSMVCWRDRLIVACTVGRRKMAEGFKIIVSHLDSPHLDLKPHPFIEKGGFCYVDTHTYGAIKKHQWVSIPLEVIGEVIRKDGVVIRVGVGKHHKKLKAMISDVSLHFGTKQGAMRTEEMFSHEDLDPMIYHGTSQEFLTALKDVYGIEEEDLLSADIEIVPAADPFEIGINHQLISAYGQDDRACAFAAASAISDISGSGDIPEWPTLVIFTDKEEVGSVGATGLDGRIVESLVDDMLRCAGESCTASGSLRLSEALCVDACPGYDPRFPEGVSEGNGVVMGGGPCVLRYTGGSTKGGISEADPHYVAKVRRILDDSNVRWQYAEVGSGDVGSCGSEAHCIAKYGGNVIDIGLPVLSLHSPSEIIAYDDLCSLRDLIKAFVLSS